MASLLHRVHEFLDSWLASLDMANPGRHSSPHPPLASKEARLISIPNELQLKILSYLSSRDLMAIVTTSKQFLEIIACILAQRGNMWWLPDVLQIGAKSYRAAKLWLWSNQGRDASFIVGLKLFVRDQEDFEFSIEFLSCISAGHPPRLFSSLRLAVHLCRVSEVDRSILERFFSLIHQLSSPKVQICSKMMQPDNRLSLPPFAPPSFPSIHELEVYDYGSFLRDSMILSSSNLRSLRLSVSSHRPEEWEVLTDLRLANLSQVWLGIEVPAHVVRAVIKHHPSLRLLDTIYATIIHDNDGDSKYDLWGHKSGLQRLHICPDQVNLVKVLIFIDLRYVKVAPEGPLPCTFLQSLFAASFPPETFLHLGLPPPQEFNYQALHNTISPQVALVNQLYLRFEAFDTVKDILNALSACVPFIKGHNLTLQVNGLEKDALDQILLAVHTSIFPDYELVDVFARNHGNKWLLGVVNMRIGTVTYSSVLDSGDSLPGI